ncbi:MAG: glycine cleavage system protein GcvH [Actinobacteria bacterium]|nr:glycine cleavage system protein GcvH [Actinomycetota bacterium]
MTPEELLFYKEHEWVRVEDGMAVVGISDYAQDMLGDIVYIGLPEVGDEVAVGDMIGEVESVKSTADLYTPLSGTITQINQKVVDTPEAVNEDPYGEGWLYRIELRDRTELDDLMSAEEYEEYTKEL